MEDWQGAGPQNSTHICTPSLPTPSHSFRPSSLSYRGGENHISVKGVYFLHPFSSGCSLGRRFENCLSLVVGGSAGAPCVGVFSSHRPLLWLPWSPQSLPGRSTQGPPPAPVEGAQSPSIPWGFPQHGLMVSWFLLQVESSEEGNSASMPPASPAAPRITSLMKGRQPLLGHHGDRALLVLQKHRHVRKSS